MNKQNQTPVQASTSAPTLAATALGQAADTGDLHYELHNGFVHAWLVAGPVTTPVHDLGNYRGEDFKAQIAQAYYRPPDITPLSPAEGRKFEQIDPTETTHALTWQLVRPEDDHYVNFTSFYPICSYVTAWAYTRVVAPVAQTFNMLLATNGPAEVWINGQPVHRQVHHELQRPKRVPFRAALRAGENEILVRMEVVGARACPFLLALQFAPGTADTLTLSLPTTRLPITRRQKLEQVFDAAYITQSVYHRNDELRVFWPPEMKLADKLALRVQTHDGRIYAEAQVDVAAGTTHNFGPVYQLPEGEYFVVLMPDINEYYLHHMQIERRVPFRVINGKHATTPEPASSHASGDTSGGITEQRRQETLRFAARQKLNLYSEIARITLGDWARLQRGPFDTALARINRRGDCADFDMVGLLGLMIRHGDDPNFPTDLHAVVTDAVLNFKYWRDEPGDDAMCYWTENHQILFHTSQVLAGQLFPDATFTNTGQRGTWHRAMGEQRALSWLHKRATQGFQEWDSNCYFNENVLALAHLADLAQDDTLAEMAAVVLDKLFFTMALNSYQGVFGSTHGRSYTGLILGGRGERTSGITYLLWGQGTLNSSITGAVGLACAQSYELPPIIAAIATDQTSQMWNRERHAGTREAWCDLDDNAWEVNKVTYRTPDYMLCSAQDYRPGTEGVQQHIWQATLSPDAVIFVNHPITAREENDLRPNFWSGNGVLPRVTQWHDALIGVYHLPDDDWMGWTHAYFPRAAFDEVVWQDNWVFGRKDDGYVALTAANGLNAIERGLWAAREIRSPGHHNIWLCQMGRRGEDGEFADFIAAVSASHPHFDDLAVRWQSIRGDELTFGWEGPLRVNGHVQPITDFAHYDNPIVRPNLAQTR